MLLSLTEIIASTTTQATTAAADGSALSQALRVSGIALVAIFVVMGLFGVLITLIGRVFPEPESN